VLARLDHIESVPLIRRECLAGLRGSGLLAKGSEDGSSTAREKGHFSPQRNKTHLDDPKHGKGYKDRPLKIIDRPLKYSIPSQD
jgi:hypothetical protein